MWWPEFDLRTAFDAGGPPKTQAKWLSAAYGSFVEKQGSILLSSL
jgi:hypothetical protein